MSTVRRLPTWLFAGALLALAAPARSAEPDPYLPNNTDTVLTVNVRQMIEAPVVAGEQERLKQTLKTFGDAQKTLEDLGVDPFKDVERLTLAKGEGAGVNRLMLIVRGKFDPKKFRDKAEQLARDRKDDFQLHQAGEYVVCQAKTPPAPLPLLPPTLYICVVEPGAIVAAPTMAGVLEAIEKKEGKARPEHSKELTEHLAKADARQSISIISLGKLGTGTLGSITTITGGVTLGNDIKADLVVGTKDGDAAKELAELIDELLNQAKALVTLMAGKEMQKEAALAVEILGALKTEAQGSDVRVKGHVTKEAVDKALK